MGNVIFRVKEDVKNQIHGTEWGKSIWRESVTDIQVKKPLKPIEDIKETEVLILGGGLAGVLTAYQLKQQGVDSIIIEADKVGNGITKNTTAKITSLHGLLYAKLLKKCGPEKAKQYYESNEKSIGDFKQIIDHLNIDCDFEVKPHFLYGAEKPEVLEEEYEAINRLGITANYTTKTKLPFQIVGAIEFPRQAQFHPLKFMKEIVADLNIYENCQVTSIEDNGVIEINHKHTIKGKHVIVATHYPIINSKGLYFVKMHQERSYVVCLQKKKGYEEYTNATNPFQLDGMYIGVDNIGYSLRNYEKYLLLGGANHRTGKADPGDSYELLKRKAAMWYPYAEVAYTWSNQDCMTLDSIPYIGRYSKSLPNFYVATGFNKWGISSSMVAANILTDMVCGKKSLYEDVFCPQRNHISGAKKFIKDMSTTTIHLSSEILKIPKNKLEEIGRGQGGTIRYEGNLIGIYKERNGTVHLVDSKCSHLGCRLSWNPNELTWDCPCHGSRFDYHGNLINNPATKGVGVACKLKDCDSKILEEKKK